jgi:hypothetical protein
MINEQSAELFDIHELREGTRNKIISRLSEQTAIINHEFSMGEIERSEWSMRIYEVDKQLQQHKITWEEIAENQKGQKR